MIGATGNTKITIPPNVGVWHEAAVLSGWSASPLLTLAGLLATASVAIDGSKFKAVNNRDRNLTREGGTVPGAARGECRPVI